MKTKTNYLNRHVLNPVVTDESPNRVGTIVRIETNILYKQKYNIYHVQFRDFREFWGVKLIKKNLVNF